MKKFDLCIVKKSFVKDGECVEYYDLSTIIDGEKISLLVKEDNKKLFKYLLKFHKYDEKGGIID